MIDNDPRRSLEFFKTPIIAGQAANMPVLNLTQILILHGLRAIFLTIGAAVLHAVMPELELAPFLGESAEMAEAMRSMMAFMDHIRSSPFQFFLINFFSSLIVTTVFWVVARNFSEVKEWAVAQSGMMRFALVAAALTLGLNLIAALGWIMGEAIGSTLQSITSFIGIYLIMIWVLVLYGIFEFRSAGTMIMVLFLSFLSLIGCAWFLSFFGLLFFGGVA